MKYDPDLKNVQKEALTVVAKVTELFIAYATEKSLQYAALRGAKTVKESDFIKAINGDFALNFLKDDFPVSNSSRDQTKLSHGSGGPENSKGKRSAQNSESSGDAVKKIKLDLTESAATDAGAQIASNIKSSLLNYFSSNRVNSSVNDNLTPDLNMISQDAVESEIFEDYDREENL